MLCLTRKLGQAVIIDGRIVVTVIKTDGRDNIVLGIEAPKDVPILREELSPKSPDQVRADIAGNPSATDYTI